MPNRLFGVLRHEAFEFRLGILMFEVIAANNGHLLAFDNLSGLSASPTHSANLRAVAAGCMIKYNLFR
jgi:hypothetical protein